MNKYFENLYKVLFEPHTAFDTLKEDTTMLIAVFTILWTNILPFLPKHSLGVGIGGAIIYLSKLIFTLVCVLIFWFAAAVFFEFTAKAFGKSGEIRTLLTLSAYSFLPYIFLPAFELIKKFSQTGYFWGTKLEILLFFWVIFLYFLALRKTYDLKKSSSFFLIFLPLVALGFAFIWVIGSVFNLGYIYNV